ncbi:hypothetical protein TSUD_349640 [Trifolium subterraneum]|uniref:Disease resistance N-terminal domain-containing protein n=1 Tax=Trifolium subterraneum TaxID=3900 RepID=A0A2Z6P6B7_TRISU|nr:hypothetical protein TSUD_349640 [Trifolium subterraneum]
MADSAVSFLLGHLSQLLQHEANLLSGVEDKIESLRNELEIINAYLKTSSKGNKNNNKEIEQIVLSQIRDAAHLAEDVIDTFIANLAIYKRRNMLGKMFQYIDRSKLLREVAEKIDKIKTTLKEIHENNIKYNQESSNQSISATEEEERKQSLQRLRRNVEVENVVGFVHESDWKRLTKDFKLVRVLDFEGRYCFKIPSNLGNFIHLSYRPIKLRSSSSQSDGEVMWHLQTIGFIGLDKRTTYLIEKGSFPKLRTLRLQISKKFKGDVPKMLLSLQQLKHLNKLEIFTDGFPQLQEFQMIDLPIRNWKLANGSMPRLQILIVHNCGMLDSLPSELWSLTTLRKVCVQKPSDAMAMMMAKMGNVLQPGQGLAIEEVHPNLEG